MKIYQVDAFTEKPFSGNPAVSKTDNLRCCEKLLRRDVSPSTIKAIAIT